jgi:hypothetical protein
VNAPTQPTIVEPGQMWKDNDQRTKGAGEFEITSISESGRYAYVERKATKTIHRIRIDRLLGTSHLQRGYTYIGMKR